MLKSCKRKMFLEIYIIYFSYVFWCTEYESVVGLACDPFNFKPRVNCGKPLNICSGTWFSSKKIFSYA